MKKTQLLAKLEEHVSYLYELLGSYVKRTKRGFDAILLDIKKYNLRIAKLQRSLGLTISVVDININH